MDFPLEKASPVFCAGVTVFTPLKENGAHLGGLTVGVMGKDISFERSTLNHKLIEKSDGLLWMKTQET